MENHNYLLNILNIHFQNIVVNKKNITDHWNIKINYLKIKFTIPKSHLDTKDKLIS